ncbi:MAG TPA: class I SAM-dependent methyltransferase [Polyangia bacterium]
MNVKKTVALSNKPLQRTAPARSARRWAVPRRRGLRPRLLAAVIRSRRPFGAAAERQVVRQTTKGSMAVNADQVQQHFRVQVPAYTELMQRLIPHYDLQRDVMVSLMPSDRTLPLRILDLGCGTGVMASRLADEFPSAQLTLFDLTDEMIDHCKSRLGANSRVSFKVGDFRKDDFGSGYDMILASLSLHHATLDERPLLAERLLRSLVPGGLLITAEVVVDESPPVRERQYEMWRRFMASQGEDADAWYQRHLAKDHPVEMSRWIRMLSDAGFASPGCFWRYLNFAILSSWRTTV